jgi:hypothetical protein
MSPAGASSLADSQTMALVVSISDATQAAFGNAMRVTFAGSTSGLDASIAGLSKRLRRLYLALCQRALSHRFGLFSGFFQQLLDDLF